MENGLGKSACRIIFFAPNANLHDPAFLVNETTENILATLERQLNCVIKVFFERNKYDHCSDLEPNNNILPVRYFLDIKAINFYWKNKNLKIAAFKRKTVFSNAKVRRQSVKNEEFFGLRTSSISLRSILQESGLTFDQLT